MYNNANCVLELTHIQSHLARDIQTVYEVNTHNVTHRYTLYIGLKNVRDNRVAQNRIYRNQKSTSLQQNHVYNHSYIIIVMGELTVAL
jgi:hypothetical protein